MKKHSPTISICMPVYNGQEFLSESLESVLTQSFEDFEVIVLDDCSSDKSREVIAKYAASDSRVKLHVNEKNLGLCGNWNKCIDLSTGKWVKFQFQDDIMQPKTIQKMIEVAGEWNTRLVLTDREYKADTTDDERTLKKYRKIKKLSHFVDESRGISAKEMVDISTKDLFDYNFLGEPILGLIHKDVFEDYGRFDCQFEQLVDFEFWLRISLNEEIGFINEELHVFRIHQNSQTTKNNVVVGVRAGLKDRVLLMEKLNSDPVFQYYRTSMEETVNLPLEKLYQKEYIKIMRKVGYLRYREAFGKEHMPTSWIKSPRSILHAFGTDFVKFLGQRLG